MAWTKKNDKTSGSVSTNPISTAAFANVLTPGSLIIVEVAIKTATIPTPTDTAGNTYYDSGLGTKNPNDSWYIAIFYALNTFSTASNVVSVANSGTVSGDVTAQEWTGNAPASPVDGYVYSSGSSGTGGGQNVTSGAPTGTGSNDLIVGLAHAGGSLSVGTNFTATADTYHDSEYQAAVAGNTPATWSDGTNNDTYGAMAVAFLPPGATLDEDFCVVSGPMSADTTVTVFG